LPLNKDTRAFPKVRSLELDTRQWSATQLALMVALGNQRVNRCYYARPPPCDEAIGATSAPRGPREKETHAGFLF